MHVYKTSLFRRRRLWSDFAHAQAVLSLHWAYMWFDRFRCVPVQMAFVSITTLNCKFTGSQLSWHWHNTLAQFEYEPRHEKTCVLGLRPGKTQTGLFSYRSKLDSWNFGYSKKRYCTIQAVNNKGADQTVPLLFAYGINRFSHDVAHIVNFNYSRRWCHFRYMCCRPGRYCTQDDCRPRSTNVETGITVNGNESFVSDYGR